MQIEGVVEDEGPFFTCGIRTEAGRWGGEVEFLLDTGAAYSLLSRRDFVRLDGDPRALRPTSRINLTSLSGSIPCRLLGAIILDFRADTGEVPMTLDWIAVPDKELWAPNILGRDFLAKHNLEFRHKQAERRCQLLR